MSTSSPSSRAPASQSSSRRRKRRASAAHSEPEASDLRAPLGRRRRDTVRRQLLAWYRESRRDLPWRRSRDPYRIWLSEAMLQQTRVETVVPYYERFLERFPDARALAVADDEAVLGVWAGLGYYARARNLRRAAVQVVRDHGGVLPRDSAALQSLPGVGRYTAGAIRSIAFGEPDPVVDGNVRRVLARLLGEPQPPDATLWTLAAELVPPEAPGDVNPALMELGAIVCRPRKPRCPECPLRAGCAARRSGRPEAFPAGRTAREIPAEHAVAGVLRRGRERNTFLMARRPAQGRLGGLWELPTAEGQTREALIGEIRTRSGIDASLAQELGSVRHVFSHRILTVRVFELRRAGGRMRRQTTDVRWCDAQARERLPLSALTRKTLRLATD